MISRLLNYCRLYKYKLKYKKRIIMKKDCILSPFSITKVQDGKVVIGKKFCLKNNAKLLAVKEGNIVIGDNVYINYNTIIAVHDKMIVGNNVSIGPNVCIYDHNHKFGKEGKEEGYRTKEVIIEDNVWIGANCTILKGSHIGKNTIIGAGCTVHGIIPSNSIVTQNRELSIEKLHS